MNFSQMKNWCSCGLSLLALVLLSFWSVPAHGSALFGAGGNLYHYDTATQTVTLKQSSIGTIEQLVELDDGTLGFGATTGGGTFYHATSPDNVNSVATGRGTFEAMTRTVDGLAYGSSVSGGSLAWYDLSGQSHSVSNTALGVFESMTWYGNGNVAVGHSGTASQFADDGGQTNVSAGWVGVPFAATFPVSTNTAVVGTTWSTGNVLLYPAGQALNGTPFGNNWNPIGGLTAFGNDYLMASTDNGGYISIRNPDGSVVTDSSGWGTFGPQVGLSNGDAMAVTTWAGGTFLRFDDNTQTLVSAGTYTGTIVDMISLASGYAIAGNDSGVLYFWNGSSFFTDDNGGSGWGNFEMFVDLDNGDALVGSDLNGGSLLLIDGAAGGFTVSSVDTSLGAFNLGGTVIPEPGTMALLTLGALGLIGRRKRR